MFSVLSYVCLETIRESVCYVDGRDCCAKERHKKCELQWKILADLWCSILYSNSLLESC